MNVIVVGGGRVGYYLAATLLGHDHHGTLIENNSATCHEVADALDIPVICGDGTSVDALREAFVPDPPSRGFGHRFRPAGGRDPDSQGQYQNLRRRYHFGYGKGPCFSPGRRSIGPQHRLGGTYA